MHCARGLVESSAKSGRAGTHEISTATARYFRFIASFPSRAGNYSIPDAGHKENRDSHPEDDYGYPSLLFVGDTAIISYHQRDGLHVLRVGVDWFYGK
jgi:hypothetical protein